MHTHVYMDMCVYKMFLFILFYGNVPSFIQNILYRFRRGHSVAETCRDDGTNKYHSVNSVLFDYPELELESWC